MCVTANGKALLNRLRRYRNHESSSDNKLQNLRSSQSRLVKVRQKLHFYDDSEKRLGPTERFREINNSNTK